MQNRGEALEVMIVRALNAAERSPDDVDYVNAHGTGTVVNDPLESAAIGRSLGPRAAEVPVSSVKGSIGHLLGAAGSVEVGLTALALRDGVAPPNVNLFEPDPQCNLNYVRGRAVEHPMNVALKIGAGFGGHIGIVLLERGDRSA